MSNICRKCAMVFGSAKALENHIAVGCGVEPKAKAQRAKAPKKETKTEDK